MLKTLLIVALVAMAAAAPDYEFAMRFKGDCQEQKSKRSYCYGKGGSQSMLTQISANDAVTFSVQELFGSFATMESQAVFYPNNTFAEYGNLTFGVHLSRDHAIYYRTFGASGRLEHFTEDGAEYAYTMTAFIEGGTGNFEGVTGLISYLGYGADELSSFTQYVSVISSKSLNATAYMRK